MGMFDEGYFWPPNHPIGGDGGESGGGETSGEWDGQTCGIIPVPFAAGVSLADPNVGQKWSEISEQGDGSLAMWCYRWMDVSVGITSASGGAGNNITIGQSQPGGYGLGYDGMISLCEGTRFDNRDFSPNPTEETKLMSWERQYVMNCGELFGCPELGYWLNWEAINNASRNRKEGFYTYCFMIATVWLYADVFIYPIPYFVSPVNKIFIPVLFGIPLGVGMGSAPAVAAIISGMATPGVTRKRKKRIIT